MNGVLNNIEWIFNGIGKTIVSVICKTIYKKHNTDNDIIVKESKRSEIKNNEKTEIIILGSEDITIEGNKN